MTNSWQEATVVSVNDQTPDFRSIILKPKKFYDFKSGNFVELALRPAQGKLPRTYKCYSVVSTPQEIGGIEVGVKLYKDGALSPKLFKFKKNNKLLMRGPTGAYFVWELSKRDTVLIAGGSGICPMISILRQYNPGLAKMYLLFSTKQGSVYYEDELNRLCSEKNINYVLIQTGKNGRVNKKIIHGRFGNLIGTDTDFFVAGPTGFVQDVSLWLRELGVEEGSLKTDDFET